MLLLSTRPGSLAAAMCAAHGGAKGRKRMMRALKGYVAASLMHRDAYVAVMRLVAPKAAAAVVGEDGIPKPTKGTTADEWVPRGNTTPKGNPAEAVPAQGGGDDGDGNDVSGMDIVKDEEEEGGGQEEGEDDEEGEKEEEEEEEEEPAPLALVSVMMHRNGCKLLLRLLAPERTGYVLYLHPQELELLEPTMVPAPAQKSAGGADGSEKEATEGTVTLVPSSKKEASVRRRELLAYLREPLREACLSHAGELMRSKFAGASVLQEVVRAIGTVEVVKAVAAAACATPLETNWPCSRTLRGTCS
ncbi:unnamed protein product [Laminaria digitata]